MIYTIVFFFFFVCVGGYKRGIGRVRKFGVWGLRFNPPHTPKKTYSLSIFLND